MKNIENIMKECSSLTLLYVEDCAIARDSMLVILEDFFVDIIVAVNGSDGLEKFKSNSIDLILTDIDMAVMDGLEMIAEIRKEDSDISIIILSAYTEPEYFTTGIKLNVDGYLLKPFDLEHFLSTMGNILNKFQLKIELKKNLDLKERMELAILGNSDGVWDWNLLDNSIYFSSLWKKMLGYSDKELPNEFDSWKSRVHPDDLEPTMASIYDNIEGKTDYYEGVHRLKHKDGHWVWILDRGKTFYDENAKAVRMSGTHSDITEQKNLELKYAQQHVYLQTIVDSVNDPIMVIKEDYTVALMNSSLSKNIKVLNQDTPKCYEISHNRTTPCDGDEHPCPLSIVMQTGCHSTVVHTHHKLNGEKSYVELSATPLFDDKENCIGIIESGRDITSHLEIQDELKEQKSALNYQAHHDALTGLANRSLFNEKLSLGIENSKANTTQLALFFIDLDNFKEINDSLGHGAGDEVLKTVTKNLSSIVRKEDTLSRLGGDEFTVVMEGLTQIKDVLLLAEKILKILSSSITIDDNVLNISGSIGISLCPNDGTSSQELLKNADEAMYRAKDKGKNNFVFYNAEIAHSFEGEIE